MKRGDIEPEDSYAIAVVKEIVIITYTKFKISE
jgi:hypothetical protein